MLRVHSAIPRSRVNGPGERLVAWVQGCTLACPGCFNAEACAPDGGYEVAVEDLARQVLDTQGIEGITLSGGEPFQQAAPAAQLCGLVRETGRSVFVFSGYTLDEIQADRDPAKHELLALTDVLVGGRYVESRKCHLLWRGSDNQAVHFLTDRYCAAMFDLETPVEEVEIVLNQRGEIQVTGFPDDGLPDALR